MKQKRYFNGKIKFKITRFQKVINEDGEESFKVVDFYWETLKAKDFENSLREDEEKGVSHKIVFCNAPPEKFQFNTIYIRNDGKAAYTFVLKE